MQEGKLKIEVYRNFREKEDGAPKRVGVFSIEGVHGGPLLGARGGGFVVFWDWETGDIVRRVDVEATNVRFVSCSRAPCVDGPHRYTGPVLAPLSLLSQRTRSMSYGLIAKHTMPHSPLVWRLVTKALKLPSKLLQKCRKGASLYTHRSDSLIWIPQRQDCQVGRRLLHLYQLCQQTELSRWYTNKYYYPFRYVSHTTLCISAFPNAPQADVSAWLHSGS